MIEEVLVEETKKVYYITLNRPEKLNAINYNMMYRLKKCFVEAEENDNIQMIVFKAAPSKAFSAGFDTNQILTLPIEKKAEFFTMNLEISEMVLTSEKLFMIVLRGFAVAAGFAFCLFSDLRVAEDNPNIYFALPEIPVGIFPYAVLALSLYYFPPSIATGLIFSGDRLSLSRAGELGFIHRIFKNEEFEKSTNKYIRSITSQNAKIQRITKICYNIERKNIVKRIQMEKDFTQVCLDPELITKEAIERIKQKWSFT